MKTVKLKKKKKHTVAVKQKSTAVHGQVEAMKIVDLHYTDDDIRHVLTAHAHEVHGVFVPEGEWTLKLLDEDFTATAKLSGNVSPRDDGGDNRKGSPDVEDDDEEADYGDEET